MNEELLGEAKVLLATGSMWYRWDQCHIRRAPSAGLPSALRPPPFVYCPPSAVRRPFRTGWPRRGVSMGSES